MSARRLFLIDGYSNIFRAFYAIRGLSNSKGMSTNAVYGFLNMLRKLLREEQPEYIGVALDVSGATVRKERYEEYKANRRPMPEDLAPQIPWIRKTLEALRIPILEQERYEADDVLATIARKAVAAGFEVVIVSADKDLMQLASEQVSILHTGREKLYGPKLVEEDYGVPPEKIIDLLALKGDASDNVPGVPGIGEKGALNLIREFGSLEVLLDRAEEVKRKSYREGLIEHREDALMSKELVTLHYDLDVPFSADDLLLEAPDPAELKSLYAELEFHTLVAEIDADSGSGGAGTIDVPAIEEAATPEAWRAAVDGWKGDVVVLPLGDNESIALVASGSSGDAEPSLQFADLRRDGLSEAVDATLGDWLQDDAIRLVGHELKEVLRRLPSVDAAPARLFDVQLVSYVCRSEQRSHEIGTLALDRLGYKMIEAKDAGWDKKQLPPIGYDPLHQFAAERAVLVRCLAEQLEEELDREQLRSVYFDLEAPLLPVLLRMEEAGIELDVEFLQQMSDEVSGLLAGLEEEIYELAGEEFNINSPKQLGELLFERLGYPVIKRTRKTKSYSTSAEILQELVVRGYDLPERILRYRELTKLKSTYIDAFPVLVADDGRLHTRYQQAVAATGRLSSTNPNLQNIPVRTELGHRIRKAFVAPSGCRLLVADYSQIELRLLAHIADEAQLQESFRNGEDVHSATAAAVLGGSPDLVTGEQRRAAKVINFGIIYGMSAYGLSQNLGIPRAEAQQFIDAYLARYSGVEAYMKATVEEAEAEGKVATLYGRVRRLPDIHSKNFNLRENARRMAINARIQGTAADLLKIAMIAVDRRLRSEFPSARLLLTVHDELVVECPVKLVEEVEQLVVGEMEQVAELAVPLVVDAGVGKSWYDAKG